MWVVVNSVSMIKVSKQHSFCLLFHLVLAVGVLTVTIETVFSNQFMDEVQDPVEEGMLHLFALVDKDKTTASYHKSIQNIHLNSQSR